jgi:enterochelin esterase-like enzyme
MSFLWLWLYAWPAIAQNAPSADALVRRATREGTPLVDAVDADARYSQLTFVWRGTPDTRSVAVIGTFLKAPIVAMTRIDRSDVWYLTARVPSGARFTYWLAENSPMVSEGPQLPDMLSALQADPLNPHGTCIKDAPLRGCKATVELPGAAPQPWSRRDPTLPAGMIEKFRLRSERLHNERSLSVYTPGGYRAGAVPQALLVVFDEGAYLNEVPTPTILDNLIAASRIPPTVGVFVGNPDQETRTRELTPNREFPEFLARELLPWIRARYTITSDRRLVIVAGSSFGGLAATYAALSHPEIFGNVLCQSGDFSWAPDHIHAMGRMADATTETGWLAKQFIRSPRLPIRFYLDAGTFEADQVGTGGNVLETSRHMRDVLLAKGYDVHYQQFVGGHDYLSWRGTFADGLIALIGLQPR